MTGQVRVLIEGINTTEGTGGAGFYFDYSSLEEAFLGTIGPVGGDAEPRRAVAVHRALGQQHVPGRVSPRLVQQLAPGLEPAGLLHGADGVQQQPDPRARQRDRRLLRPRHQRRRPDQEGQDLVLRHLPQADERGGAAELPVRQDLRHQAVERGRQGHLPDRTRRTRSSATTSGARRCSRTACPFAHLHLRRRRNRPGRRIRAAGSTRASGTARSATSCISKRATATSATTSRCSPTATRTSSSATPANCSRSVRTRSSSSIATASSTTSPATYFLDTAQPAATPSRWVRSCCKEQSWEGYEARRGGRAASSTSTTTASRRRSSSAFPTASCAVASLAAHDCLTSRSALDQLGAFVNDTWSKGKLTINAGVRFDQLQGLAARAGAARRHAAVRSRCAAQDLPRDRLLHLERRSRPASA